MKPVSNGDTILEQHIWARWNAINFCKTKNDSFSLFGLFASYDVIADVQRNCPVMTKVKDYQKGNCQIWIHRSRNEIQYIVEEVISLEP